MFITPDLGFKTDVEIGRDAGGGDGERELEKWEPEGEYLIL